MEGIIFFYHNQIFIVLLTHRKMDSFSVNDDSLNWNRFRRFNVNCPELISASLLRFSERVFNCLHSASLGCFHLRTIIANQNVIVIS